MPTTREVTAAKAERLRHEQRHYTPDLLGRPCVAGCGLRMPHALLKLGINAHPTCGPNETRNRCAPTV